MLPFMRNQSQDQSVEETETGYIKPEKHDKKVQQSTILLVAVFVIGLMGLWFMKSKIWQQDASATATADNEQIEMAIEQLTGMKSETLDQMDKMVKRFYEFSDFEQVEVDDLTRNPFENVMPVEADFYDLQTDENDESAEELRLRRAAANMKLLSIMTSSKSNCCMIDDKLLYTGDTIGDFKVAKISDNFVELKTADLTIVLKMDE